MIDTLTSLRFIFALMVFGAHCYVLDDAFGAFVFKEGFVGVSFFFVLSGFIISYNYQHRLEACEVTRRSFWVARFARVYPLHWLTLLVSVACGAFCLSTDWAKHFLASFALVQAYVPRVDYFFSFNSPSWSLCCEQLFYFAFPFVALWLRSSRRLCAAFAVMAVLVVVGMWHTPEESIKGFWYVNPVTRFPDFIVGMMLYRLYAASDGARRMSLRAGTAFEVLAVAVFLLFFFGAEHVSKVYRYSCYYWLPVALVLYAFSLQRGALSRLLAWRPLVVGGEISYGFYLIHLLVIMPYAEWQRTADAHIPGAVAIPTIFVLVVLLSLLSYYCYERPANKWIKKRFNK